MCDSLAGCTINGTASKCSDKFLDREMSVGAEQGHGEDRKQDNCIVETVVTVT
jgi:hypothetical protein